MKKEKFWKILFDGGELRHEKIEHGAKAMHLKAKSMGMSKRVAKRYVRINRRFYYWVNVPANSIRALDILASCPLVTDRDIRRENRLIGRLMRSRDALKLVRKCEVRENPYLDYLVSKQGDASTIGEIKVWKSYMRHLPVYTASMIVQSADSISTEVD